jgi:hypothetical protein
MAPVDRWTWVDVVRRARLGRTTKGVALLLATYADNDGSRVFPGVATASVAAEVDYKTAKRAIADLVKAGLLEVVGDRTRKAGSATEYRLVLAEDVLERIDVLTPAAFELEAARRRGANRRTGARAPRSDASVRGSAAPVVESTTGNGTTTETDTTGNGTTDYGDPLSAVHNHYLDTTTTTPTDEEVRAAVTGPRETHLRLVQPSRDGFGFCLACHANGQMVLAADPVAGRACALHLREAS